MRGWTIAILVVLYAWFLIIGPPALLVPAILFTHRYTDPLFLAFMSVFTLPGRWILLHIWPGFFQLTWYEFFHGAGPGRILTDAFAWLFAIVFGYFFWLILLSRFWKLTGRWNPFGWKTYRHRPHFLRAYGRFSDWWESAHVFGQRATGGFSSLTGVLANEFKHGDIFLGRPKLYFGGMLRPIGIPTEKHMVTIANTGSGKSTGALIPNLCIHEGSLLCVDPKGELAAVTARRRGEGGGGVRGMGMPVFVLNPFNLPILNGLGCASYNVFDEMERVAEYDADRPVSYAAKVAQALIPASTSRDPYWDNASRTFITGLLLYILQGPKEHRNLVRLRTLLMEGDTATYNRVTDGKKDDGDAFDALNVMMENCPEGPYRHVIAGAAASISRMSHNQRGGVLTTAMEHTSFLDMPEIRRISMKSDFLLEDLKNSYISVYLCLPLNAVSGIEGRWLRMFVLLTVDMMMRASKAPKPPILLAIDEFPSLNLQNCGMESAAPTLRSYGVRLWVCGQDLEAFERVYPDSWGGFIGNAEAVQFMGIKHAPTVAWLAERLGQHVVVDRQRMGRQVRDVPSERAVRDPDQVARMLSKKNQIVWRGSERPMLLKLCPYFQYMPWWYYSRDRRFPEKFNRWIWRWGSDRDVTPSTIPPVPPRDIPPKPPPPKPPGAPDYFSHMPPEKREAAPESLYSYLPQEPGADVRLSDIVPGTRATWGEALTNYMGRRVLEGVDRVEAKLDRMAKADLKTYFGTDALRTPEQQKADSEYIEEVLRRSAAGEEHPFAPPPKPPRKAPVKGPEPRDPAVLPPRTEKSPAGDALDELDGLIGLDEVKARVREAVEMVGLRKERERQGMPRYDATNHLVFTGNPGTGKTTVARIVADIYKGTGVLKKGHLVEVGRADLVAGYIGQTAPRVKELITSAIDGVLFIDEAYLLAPADGDKDFGAEAVGTLIKAMEDYRDRLVVIVAGYKDEMAHFMDSNPGLKSRFNEQNFIEFQDYDAGELFRIFNHMASAAAVRPSSDAAKAAASLMESLEIGKKGFGNARTVRNIFQTCMARQAKRLATKGRSRVDITMFEKEDIPEPGEIKKV